ncbi:hypothetical protein [Arthrobacter sp. M4]|uniref:hypothetical protein n=1 Tax=Arthrobacter sp. M4 TaxID=218160 RepID=UPI001CDC0854|nr:hypothetical protein [Arthrobacter sp. M4]MCA4134603.1 hypothetical protein [Arthrobacter sp. M4]
MADGANRVRGNFNAPENRPSQQILDALSCALAGAAVGSGKPLNDRFGLKTGGELGSSVDFAAKGVPVASDGTTT